MPTISMGNSKKQPNGMESYCHDVEVEPAYYYRYAQSLRSIGENDKANQIMEKLKMSETTQRRTLRKKKTIWMPSRLIPEDIKWKMRINSPYSDYGTTIYSDKIVFASTRYRKFRP
jgi:hypothetical protein